MSKAAQRTGGLRRGVLIVRRGSEPAENAAHQGKRKRVISGWKLISSGNPFTMAVTVRIKGLMCGFQVSGIPTS